MARRHALLNNEAMKAAVEQTRKELEMIRGVILDSVIEDSIDRRDALGKNGKLKKSLTIAQWQRKTHQHAINSGFWQKGKERPVPEILCLIHSEVSEALEAYRKNDNENFKEEFADIAIRLLDASEGLGIDLESEIEKKYEKNLLRPFMHGGKKC
jgi:NTP pyrophosphatase (non-canonical NTP hydrolase)